MKKMMKLLLLFLFMVFSEGNFLNRTDQNQNLNLNQTPTLLQNRYLSLPMFLDSDLPLVHRDYFSPARGTGQEPLPDPVRQLLLPVRTGTDPTSLSGATVRTSCERNRMQLQVDRRVLGLGEPVAHLSLGSCRVSRSTQDFLYFEHELHLCGTGRKMFQNRIVYFNELRYDPPEPPGPVRRTAPFSLPVACYFNRFVYSYKIGYRPKVQIRKVLKKMKNSSRFVLTLRNAEWEELSRPPHYVLGEPMFFQAESFLSDGERLYVHSCHVTPETSHLSTPQYPVVKNFGCMEESRSSRSRFLPHRTGAVRFSVDAFLFKGSATQQQLYMHCSMSVGGANPTPTAKSCNYDSKTRRWVEVSGSDSVCGCCESSCGANGSAENEVFSSTSWTVAPQVRSMSNRNRKKAEGAEPELRWPFRGGGEAWVEEEGEETHVKGSAVVEEEEEEEGSKPDRMSENLFDFE